MLLESKYICETFTFNEKIKFIKKQLKLLINLNKH